ncbi:hypothetical protein FZC78_06360 [Rossellomorea vietnamensis]|uniref:Uncharacterized protein n=1 Tax=Rossellomorea vietnamensis TaxID=218284 RepID=A0A5D4NUF5_9BACI|nr:hypothetical protein [Rossellomorea vietnamensis]TYS17499.1 hypothetical protein FZC78_06360 [Rossellomorea vietnamensis]
MGLIKYNIHLFVFFFALSFLFYGQSWALPVFLKPILFILMIIGFVFSAVAGGLYKKEISTKEAKTSKSIWIIAFMLITISTIFYEPIETALMVVILAVSGLYLLSSIFSLLKKEEVSTQ